MNDPLRSVAGIIVDDVAPVEAAIPGMSVSRLERGRNETELTLVGVDDIHLCVGRFDFKVTTEGGIGADELRIALQLEAGAGSWNGKAFDLNRFWVYRPGTEHAGAADPDEDGHGVTWATFTLPLDAMVDGGSSDVVDRTDLPSVLNADAAPLRSTIADIVTAVRNGTFTVDQARRARRELFDASASLLDTAEGDRTESPSTYKITRRCVAVADDLDPIPTTAELAAALDVSDRWIRSSFERVYGVSVSEFFRACALHRARRRLMGADPASTSVAEIAMSCGFWHLGRFSGYYHSHFGEHPRTTLRRAA